MVNCLAGWRVNLGGQNGFRMVVREFVRFTDSVGEWFVDKGRRIHKFGEDVGKDIKTSRAFTKK